MRYAFPQPYTDAEAAGIVTLPFKSLEKEPRKRQASIILQYSRSINSGVSNVLEIISCLDGGYLSSVKIHVLPFRGEGNRLRVYIHSITEGDTLSQEDADLYQARAEYMSVQHPEMVPIQCVITYGGRIFYEQILYLQPPWYDPKATIESLEKESAARSSPPP
jgi:hypothetical protein